MTDQTGSSSRLYTTLAGYALGLATLVSGCAQFGPVSIEANYRKPDLGFRAYVHAEKVGPQQTNIIMEFTNPRGDITLCDAGCDIGSKVTIYGFDDGHTIGVRTEDRQQIAHDRFPPENSAQGRRLRAIFNRFNPWPEK